MHWIVNYDGGSAAGTMEWPHGRRTNYGTIGPPPCHRRWWVDNNNNNNYYYYKLHLVIKDSVFNMSYWRLIFISTLQTDQCDHSDQSCVLTYITQWHSTPDLSCADVQSNRFTPCNNKCLPNSRSLKINSACMIKFVWWLHCTHSDVERTIMTCYTGTGIRTIVW